MVRPFFMILCSRLFGFERSQQGCNTISLVFCLSCVGTGFNSLFLYRRWYRCFTALGAFYKDDGFLERKNISLDEFCADYSGKKPV